MKLTMLGSGVRAPFVLRGLAASRGRPRAGRGRAARHRPGAPGADGGARRAPVRGVGRGVHGPRRARRPRGRRRRSVRLLGHPAGTGGGPRRRRGGAAQARRARAGDHGPRWVRHGAPDDPGHARLRAADRGGGARRAARELHEPRRDRDAGPARPLERSRGGDLRRPHLDAAERRGVPGPAPRTCARRLLRAEPLRVDPPRAGRRARASARAARPVRRAPSRRRTVAAVRPGPRACDRDAPHGVPLLLLLPGPGRRAHPRLGRLSWPATPDAERRPVAGAAGLRGRGRPPRRAHGVGTCDG